MEIICIQGSTPGDIVATLTHETHIQQVPMTLRRHEAGGWHIQRANGEFGPRCHGVAAAVLLEASEVFVLDDVEMAVN